MEIQKKKSIDGEKKVQGQKKKENWKRYYGGYILTNEIKVNVDPDAES